MPFEYDMSESRQRINVAVTNPIDFGDCVIFMGKFEEYVKDASDVKIFIDARNVKYTASKKEIRMMASFLASNMQVSKNSIAIVVTGKKHYVLGELFVMAATMAGFRSLNVFRDEEKAEAWLASEVAS